MRTDRSERNQPIGVDLELTDVELQNVVGGATAKPNANRYDPYKSFKFRVTS